VRHYKELAIENLEAERDERQHEDDKGAERAGLEQRLAEFDEALRGEDAAETGQRVHALEVRLERFRRDIPAAEEDRADDAGEKADAEQRQAGNLGGLARGKGGGGGRHLGVSFWGLPLILRSRFVNWGTLYQGTGTADSSVWMSRSCADANVLWETAVDTVPIDRR
jgi:hypothetical protein